MATTLATLYSVIILGVIGFQIALIAGAPWGRITQGGRHSGPLPLSGRIAAAVSIGILAFFATAIFSAAAPEPFWPIWTGWVAVALQALSTLANWATPSQPERRLWAPITSVMLALAGSVMALRFGLFG